VFLAMGKVLDNSNLVSFDNEKLILTDKFDCEIGFADKKKCHNMPGVLHRAFSIFLFNHQNQVLIHKRSPQKKLWPNYWTNSCCSHPRKGENLEQAIRRRLSEELGLTCSLQYMYKFIYQARYKNIGAEHELCHVYFGKTSQKPMPNPNEISEMKWISIPDLSREIQENSEIYTPWIKLEWPVICNQFLSSITTYSGCE
tara:strand:+ start:41810 stop:42406 length:597 start_codon:yes stop_codon:yes gene_type:complete